MKWEQRLILGLVVFGSLLLLAGCQGGEIDPRPGSGSISIQYNEFTVSDSSTSINATVAFELYVDGPVEFEGVTGCTFDGDGQVIQKDLIGTLTTPTDSGRMEFDSRVRPEFIVVDHPKLAEFDGIGRMVLRWNETFQYYERDTTADLTFDYRPPTEPGNCGSAT